MDTVQDLASAIEGALSLASGMGLTKIADDLAKLAGAVSGSPKGRPAGLRVDFLSGEVKQAGRVLRLPDREIALVMALALERHLVFKSSLCHMLYPDIAEDQAGNLVKIYVHRIRTRLGDRSVIEFAAGGYRLRHDCCADFRHIEEFAKRLIRGEGPLSAAERARASEASLLLRARRPERLLSYDWYQAADRRFTDLGRTLSVILAEEAGRAGNTAHAVGLLDDLLTEDACDERAQEALIKLHLQRGDRASAMHQFRLYRASLARELSLSPSASLLRLVAATQ